MTLEYTVGAPYLWKHAVYGNTAVHIVGIYNGIATISIDGGLDSTQCRTFPELAIDGTWFTPLHFGELHKRPERTKRATVTNTVRKVPGVGDVAFVAPTATEKPQSSRRTLRVNLRTALAEARRFADNAANGIDWPAAMDEVTF